MYALNMIGLNFQIANGRYVFFIIKQDIYTSTTTNLKSFLSPKTSEVQVQQLLVFYNKS